MLATLIPLFDENMSVSAYSLFSQRENFLKDPRYFVTAQLDGAGTIDGLEIINNNGLETLSSDNQIFVSLTNVSIFADVTSQCDVPHSKIIFLLDRSIKPTDMYIARIYELKAEGYHFAIRKLHSEDFDSYEPILKCIDYVFLNTQSEDFLDATSYFHNLYPEIKLIAGNINTQDEYTKCTDMGGFELYEGPFYRVPITKGDTDVSPLKINYIQLLNAVNIDDFDLQEAADIIGRDTALVISLLKIVNNMTANAEITTIRHAAAMLGQKELKKWITTAVAKQMCFDKPNEIMRLSLVRAKFAENLATNFGLAVKSQELFLMGLFSVLDLILNKPMEEALTMLNISNDIKKALIDNDGPLADIYNFMQAYESANWQEVSRIIIVNKLNMAEIYNSYVDSLKWYTKLLQD